MSDAQRFARLTSIACHDLRTPLATVYGFARSLTRLELGETEARYVEMIEAASAQLADLLDQLALVARIETGRFEAVVTDVDSLELARAAVDALGPERVAVSGEGARVRVHREHTKRAVGQLARAAQRHAGLDSVDLVVRGAELEISPVTPSSEPVLVGEELRELQAAAAGDLIRALGGALEVVGAKLVVRLPQ